MDHARVNFDEATSQLKTAIRLSDLDKKLALNLSVSVHFVLRLEGDYNPRMTKQQKINSLEAFYEKPARKAKFLSKDDFSKAMRWGSVIGFVVGVLFFGLGAMGVIGGTPGGKAPAYAFAGLFICLCAILSIAFPGFRRFYDGGTINDIFDKEATDLAEAWANCVPDVTADHLKIEDPLFWGTTGAMSCIVLVKWDRPNAGGDGGAEFFLAAHCDKTRTGKPRPNIGKGKCVGLNHVFRGGFEDIERQLNDLTGQSLETMRKVIEANPKMELDPLIYGPYAAMLCPRS